MWIRRQEWARLVAADARREAVEQQLAVLQNSFEWLRVLYNNTVLDRDAIARQVGVTLPTPQIRGQAAPAFVAGSVDPRQVAIHNEHIAELNARRAAGDAVNIPLRPGQMGDNDPTAVDGLEGFAASLYDDVGDELAAAHGIKHDTEGNAIYAGKEG